MGAIWWKGKKILGIGAKGKSAYEQAKAGGFKGTEQQFNQALAKILEYQTKDQVNQAINNSVGEINKVVDRINGEVI